MAVVEVRPTLQSSKSGVTASSCNVKGACDLDFHGDLAVTDEVPSEALLKECGEQLVYSADGTAHTFKSLFSNIEQNAERHLIIFTRHFLCGLCQDYLRVLSSVITPKALAATTPPTSVSIIGCMQPSMIESYSRITNSPFPVYADPSRTLYAKLGLIVTLEAGKVRPKYQVTPMPEMMLKAIGQGVREGTNMFKGGNMRQVGGEFLFDGAGKLTWCHRMKNTRDHTEVEELARRLGIPSR